MDSAAGTDRAFKGTARRGEGVRVLFEGIRFVLAGFDPATQNEYGEELKHNGGFDVGRYDTTCTHVIVYQLTYDDPICAVARKDGKALVTHLWVADSLDKGVLADTDKVLYRPVRDMIGIPGSASLCICLTGYQGQDRRDIMRMVEIMGPQFTKPLIASKVTHLICYKHEGDKYRLAKQMGLKLVNHRWLEDCLKVWALLPEENYLKSGWEVELLEAKAKDSEDDRLGRSCLPTLLTHDQFSGSHDASSHGPLVTPNSKPFLHPMSDELVLANKKFSGTKHSPRELTETRTSGQIEKNEKLSNVESGDEPGTRKCHPPVMPDKNNEEKKPSGVRDKEARLKQTVCITTEMSNHEKEVVSMSRLDGVESTHMHSTKITDMVSGNELPQATDVCLEKLNGERQIPSSNRFLEICETTAVDNYKDSIGGMMLVDKSIQISADGTSRIGGAAAKSPWMSRAGSVLKVRSNQTLAGFSPTHLTNEMSKNRNPNTLSLKIKKSISSGLVQGHDADICESTDQRERDDFVEESENGLISKTNGAKQQSKDVICRSLTADHQSETPSGNMKMQTCQDKLSIGCNSSLKKDNSAEVGSVSSNISSSFEKGGGTENVASSMLAEGTSTKVLICDDKEFHHVANDQAYDLENVNVMNHFDGRGNKAIAQTVEQTEEHKLLIRDDKQFHHVANDEAYDLENVNVMSHFDGCGDKAIAQTVEQTEEYKLSGSIATTGDWKLSRPMNKKRPGKPKVSDPKKRKAAIPNVDLNLCRKENCPKSDETDCREEMDKLELGVERENSDNGMVEIKKTFNNDAKTHSGHTTGGLCSETFSVSTSLLQHPVFNSSMKERRNLGLTRRGGAEETDNRNANIENSNYKKDKLESSDLNVPTASTLSHKSGLDSVQPEIHNCSADLGPVSTSELLSGSIDNKPLQFSGERGSISSMGDILSDISKEKCPSKASRKQSSEKGKHPCDEIAVGIAMPDQLTKENEDLEYRDAAAIQDISVNRHFTVSCPDDRQLQFSRERGLFPSTGNNLLDVAKEKYPNIGSKRKANKRRKQSCKRIAVGVEMFDQSTIGIKDMEKADTAVFQDELVDAQQMSGFAEAVKPESGRPMASHTEKEFTATPVLGVATRLYEELKTSYLDELPSGDGLNSSFNRSNPQRKCLRGRPKLSDGSKVKVDSNRSANKSSFEPINGNNDHVVYSGVLSSQPQFAEEGNSILEDLKITENLPSMKKELNKNQEQRKNKNDELPTPLRKVDIKLLANDRNASNTSRASRGRKAKDGAGINTTTVKEEFHRDGIAVGQVHGRKEDVSRGPYDSSNKVVNRKQSTKLFQRTKMKPQSAKSEKAKSVCSAVKLERSMPKTTVHLQPRLFILAGRRLERKEFQIVIKQLGGRLCKDSHQWSYQATHLIAPEPLRRTEKFFAAAAAGRWIITAEYLRASKNAGRFLDEHEYEWHKSGLNEDGTISFEAPRKWRLLRENTGCCAFHGLRIIVYGDCIAPPLHTLKRVVKAGGGAVLATCPPYNRLLAAGVDFAIISPGIPPDDMWIQEFLCHDVACVLVDYLVEYICKPSHPIQKHVLYNTYAAVEKSLKGLKMNIESAASNQSEGTLFVEKRKDIKVEEEQVDEIYCSVCRLANRDDVMLLCGDGQGRGCSIAMHIDCCQPPLDSVPEDDWFCPKCQPPGKPKMLKGSLLVESRNENKVEKGNDEIYCTICRSADRDDVMLLCGDDNGRGCGIAIHIDCCQPPLDSVPEEDWFCPKCRTPDKPKKKALKRAKRS